MVCTAVTTICGVWLAYGEPPNLIMKANLYPYLGNAFFLALLRAGRHRQLPRHRLAAARQARPAARRSREHGRLDANAADVRFLQATRHGEVHDAGRARRGPRRRSSRARAQRVIERLRRGESLGIALDPRGRAGSRRAGCCSDTSSARNWPTASTATTCSTPPGEYEAAFQAELAVDEVLAAHGAASGAARRRSARSRWCRSSACSSCTASTTRCRCFWRRSPGSWRRCRRSRASPRCARWPCARPARVRRVLLSVPAVSVDHAADERRLLRRDAEPHPLRASRRSARRTWPSRSSSAATFLSAILDNNVVADFASRGLHGLDIDVLQLFAMAQIAGYALGGCWTHIGCAQSVVAFAFIQRDVDDALHARAVDPGDDAGHHQDSRGADGRSSTSRARSSACNQLEPLCPAEADRRQTSLSAF